MTTKIIIIYLLILSLITTTKSNTINLENKFEYTFKTVCKSDLNFEFKFYNYMLTNTTSFNYSERNNNIVFFVDNVYKKTSEDIDLTVTKNMYDNKQIITFLFIGDHYKVKNILKVNIILDNCSNFRNMLQLSYKNDGSKLTTDSFLSNKEGNFDIIIPKFSQSSDQLYKFYFVDNLFFSNILLTISFSTCLVFLYAAFC